MDLNLLKIFICVAEEKSVTKASEKLGFAQSNVTSRVKQLEKNLSCELFHRIPKGVILTKEGKIFYPHAKDIVKKMELSMREIQNFNTQTYLKIGSTESNAVTKIVPFLMQLRKDFPKIHIELIINTTKDINQSLGKYEVDIAFVSGKPQNENFLILNEIKEKLVLIEPKDVASPNIYLSFKDGCAYTNVGEKYFRENSRIEKRLEFGSYETILGCVKIGMGKSILPLSIVRKIGYETELKITALPREFSLHTYLICQKDYLPNIKNYLQEFKFLR